MKKYNILQHYSNFQPSYDYTSKNPVEAYLLPISLIKRYQALKEKFKNNKLKDNSVVYFSPFTDYPLFKFKDYVYETKLNIKRLAKFKDEVTTVVINDVILNKFESLNTSWKDGLYYFIDKKFYDSKIKPLIKFQHYENHKSAELTTDNIIIHESHVNKITNKVKLDIAKLPTLTGKLVEDTWGDKKYFNVVPLLEEIIDKAEQGDIDLVFDTQINSAINEGMEMDEDMFSTIYDMIISNDGCNIKIAQELISNLSPNTLKPYLLYLCHNFPVLARYGESKTWKYTLDQIKQDKDLYKTDYLQHFLHVITKTYPDYLPIIFKCIGYNLNKNAKKEVIKEISITTYL